MTAETEHEVDRQYRVLQQRLFMHGVLRDRYKRRRVVSESLMLVTSALLGGTTFAGDEVYGWVGLPIGPAKFSVGVFSLLAFGLSLALIVLDWGGYAASHEAAYERWGAVLQEFRQAREASGSWPSEQVARLSATYWEADRNSIAIPQREFNALKCEYLHTVRVSEMASQHPGCPTWLLSTVARWRGTRSLLGDRV